MRSLFVLLFFVLAGCRTGSSSASLKDASDVSANKLSCSNGQNLVNAANGVLTITTIVNGQMITYKLIPIAFNVAPAGQPELSCTQGVVVFTVWTSALLARVGNSYFKLQKTNNVADATSANFCSDGQSLFTAANDVLTIASIVNGSAMTYKMSSIAFDVAPASHPELSCTLGEVDFMVWMSMSLARIGGGYFKLAPN